MIEISDVNKTYETGDRVIKDMSLTINDDGFVLIVGKGGSDRSTLMKLLLKELEPTKGRVIMNDMDLERMPRRYVPKYRKRLGVVFQDFRLLKDHTAFEDVTFTQRVIRVPVRVIRETVPEMLRLVGLSSRYKAYPRQPSGGERQRVATVRALINNPEVLLADEPTGNLDNFDTHKITRFLKGISQRGTTVTVVTCSQEMVDEMNRWIITVGRGSVISDVGEYYQSVALGALKSLWACFFRRKSK